MSPALAVPALVIPLVLGHALLRLVGVRFRDDPLSYCGWTFPVGALSLAIILFASMALGISVRGPIPGGLATLIGVGLLFVRRAREPESEPSRSSARPPLLGTVLASLLAIACFVPVTFDALGDLRRPIHLDDDATIWAMKARFLYHHETFGEELAATMADPIRGGHHLDYPLLNPLLQVWVQSVAGGYVDDAIRWPTMMWLASFVFMVLGATRRRCGALTGSLLSFVLVSCGMVSLVGTGTKSDLITSLALLGLLDAGLRVLEDRGRAGWIALAALFAAILVWSKNEGIMLAAVALIAFGMTRPGPMLRALFRPTALFFLVPVLLLIAQWVFNERFGLVNDLMTGGEGRDTRSLPTMLLENFPERVGLISKAFWINLGWTPEHGRERFAMSHGLYLLFLVLVVLCPRHALARRTRPVTLTCLGGLAAYFLVYVISYQDLAWHLFTSLPRVCSHLLPAMVLGTAIMLRALMRPVSAGISGSDSRN